MFRRKSWQRKQIPNVNGVGVPILGHGATILGVNDFLKSADVWINPTISATVTGDPVAIIASPYSQGFTTSPNFQRDTLAGTEKPDLTGSGTSTRLVFDGTNDILDYSLGYSYVSTTTPADPFYCEAGKGPTACGLARAGDGTWWIGHFGKKNESTAGSETFDGSLIHYSSDFSTILQEIRFQSLGLSGVGIQGVAIDAQDGMIWCADPNNNRVYKINPVGPAIDKNFASITGANGIAYDSINNQILTCAMNSATVTRRNKTTGASVSTFTIRDITNNSLDMLFFYDDGTAAGALFTTGRDNGTNGRIIKYDLNRQATPVRSWSISQVKSAEGIYISGTEFWFCSDEYYHNQAAGVNRIVYGTFDPTSTELGNRMIIAGIFKIAATPVSTVTLLAGGDPVTTGGSARVGTGLYYTNTAGTFRLIHHNATNQVAIDWASLGTTTEAIFYIDLNTTANSATLYLNGTIVGSAQVNANMTGTIPRYVWSLGGDYENAAVAARFGNVTIGGLIITSDATHQAEYEGYLAWQTGNQALLPGGHAYASAPPT